MEQSILRNDFRLEIYNELSSVEDANRKVKQDGYKEQFLIKSARLLMKYNLQDKLGIGLLHKHNKCELDELMIQAEDVVFEERALTTRPVKHYADRNSIVPNVWTIVDGEYYPLEFTTDPLACKLFHEAEIPQSFLDEYRDQVNNSPVGNFFGIAVVEREFYNSADNKPEDFPLEYSNEAERSNVIFLRPRSQSSKAIETSWSFKRQIDINLGCDPSTYCTSACRTECIVDEDVHSRLHFDHHHVAHEHKYTGW